MATNAKAARGERFPFWPVLAVYLALRAHPVTYDIGRHIEALSLAPQRPFQAAFPKGWSPLLDALGLGGRYLPSYGLLSIVPQLGPWSAAFLLITLGAVGVLTFTYVLFGFLKRRGLTALWPLLLIPMTVGTHQALLFANHPFEVALFFSTAAALLCLDQKIRGGILLATGSLLIHPNAIGIGFLTYGLALVLAPRGTRVRTLGTIILCFAGLGGFYWVAPLLAGIPS